VAVLLLAQSAFAADPPSAELAARRLAERAFVGKQADAVRRLPDLPFYEIWIDRNLVYTDLDAKVLIIGNLLDGGTLANLREARLSELTAVPFKDLPLDGAIKTVHGRGRNQMAVFADPNCVFCKRYEAELKSIDDVTIYTVMYPVLGPDSRVKARAILCAPSPEKAWRAWMDKSQPPPAPKDSCQPPLDRNIAFGRKNDVGMTPTTFLESGKRLSGVTPAVTLNAEFRR
jgi:thiol:disulfide interchange protein DsbC